MGWKLELASKRRRLSAPIQLTDQELRDYIFKGTNLPKNKRNALVNGSVIKNSGVADYILFAELDEIQTVDDIFTRIEKIDKVKLEPIYLIFTANNFRTDKEKKSSSAKSTDGKRPLAVRVKWTFENGKLKHKFLFDEPCKYTGYDVKLDTINELRKMGKFHPQDMSEEDFHDPSIFQR